MWWEAPKSMIHEGLEIGEEALRAKSYVPATATEAVMATLEVESS